MSEVRETRKNKLIAFRVTDQEYARIERIALALDEDPNNWCRNIINTLGREGFGLTKTERLLYEEIAQETLSSMAASLQRNRRKKASPFRRNGSFWINTPRPKVSGLCATSLALRPPRGLVVKASMKWLSSSSVSTSVRVLLVEKTDRLYRNLKDYVTMDELDLEKGLFPV